MLAWFGVPGSCGQNHLCIHHLLFQGGVSSHPGLVGGHLPVLSLGFADVKLAVTTFTVESAGLWLISVQQAELQTDNS